MFRKALLQVFYYWQVVTIAAFFFLLFSTFSNQLSEFHNYNPNNNGPRTFLGVLLLYQLLGLFIIINFKRKEINCSTIWFSVLSGLIFLAFIMPSLIFLVAYGLAISGVE